ncbi:MAG: AAA family ATPase [Desulfovibrio sp.]|jgi:exonuclease SbcC|nr:AAA family ATPase [Desulfovibrio sp.]
MRILGIRLRNLNSLAGDWEIDFTHPLFVGDGIFAITGPTGAGKSTILDAICLALYGRTPRLNRISQSANEIMTRRRSDCMAEVSFETESGRFRCHWSQQRARRVKGLLQAPKHELADADSNAVLSTGLRATAERIEAETGMNFEQFTRSMLLAQGNFAKFLQAGPDERAPILERISGTDIYSRISMRVQERCSREQKKVEELEKDLAGLPLLAPEEEQELKLRLRRNMELEAGIGAKIEETHRAVAWLLSLKSLEEDLQNLDRQESDWEKRMLAFAPDRERLARAERAFAIGAAYSVLLALRQEQNRGEERLDKEKQTLPALIGAAQKADAEFRSAGVKQEEKRAERLKSLPLLHRARELDVRLADYEMRAQAAALTVREMEKKYVALQSGEQAAFLELEEKKGRLGLVAQRIETGAADAALSEKFAGFSERLQIIQEQDEELRVRQRAFAEAEQDFARKAAAAAKSSYVLAAAQKALEAAGTKLEAGRTKLEAESTQRESVLLAKIAALEEERRRLLPGEPCPLCGAREHPFALADHALTGSVLVSASAPAGKPEHGSAQNTRFLELAVQRAKAMEELEREIFALSESLGRRKEEFTGAEKAVMADSVHCEAAGALLERLRRECLEAENRAKKALELFRADLRPFGLENFSGKNPAALRKNLLERRDAWARRQNEKVELEKELADLSVRAERQRDLRVRAREEGEKEAGRLEALLRERDALATERLDFFSGRSADLEEEGLNFGEKEAQDAFELARKKLESTRRELGDLQSGIAEQEKALAGRAPRIGEAEENFLASIKESGFVDEKHYVTCLLPDEERKRLDMSATGLAGEKREIESARREKSAALVAGREKKLTDLDLAGAGAEHERLLEEQKQAQRESGGLTQTLLNNEKILLRRREQVEVLAVQKAEYRRWEALYDLIGSADGKKYRNYVQGLTFEMMINLANRQLGKMSDRYLLMHDREQSLGLDVLDNWQAGEIRSAKNLSGGESFIVSLALALGLADMAGERGGVDSLFLDEGFGALDEEALDTALDTLSGLKREGKLIGLISHVPAIRERIGARIQVNPLRGGLSGISGPGCQGGGL